MLKNPINGLGLGPKYECFKLYDMYTFKKLTEGFVTILKGEIGMWTILLLLGGIIWLVSNIL